MQTTIQYTPNVKVMDCVEWILKRITIANGYLTDGIVVDRKRDPRAVVQNKINEYRHLNSMVRIKLSDWKKDPTGPIQSTRKIQTMELICGQTLVKAQDDAGIDCEMIKDWLRHDIEWALRDDMQLLEAAAAVKAEKQTQGIDWGDAPGVINLKMDQGLAGTIVTHPDVYQTLVLSYKYDEFRPHGVPSQVG